MRSSSASHRGWFGLIRKGTGAVYGVARLVDVGAPLSPAEMISVFERHRIPEGMIRSGEVAKWNVPWKLDGVLRLARSVPYRHQSGAVTWVQFDDAVSEAIARQLNTPSETDVSVPPSPRAVKTTSHEPRRSSLAPAEHAVHASQLSSSSSRTAGALIGEVTLTQGNIDHNHIYLRSFFERFPEDAVGGSNRHERARRDVLVEWGGPVPVRTDLDGSKRFFRARGWIRDFFVSNEAQAGDRVRIEETAPYCYRVSLKKRAR
ncbi:hypothetical protein [Consotaella salsifontis]|nr:hypothetical protein [Consotaella salsifontis]